MRAPDRNDGPAPREGVATGGGTASADRRRIVVIGDSHIHALKSALAASPRDGSDPLFTILRPQVQKEAKVVGDTSMEVIMATAAELGPGDLLALTLRGNQYNSIGLLQHPRPFDVLLPDAPDEVPLPGAEIIPYRVLRAYFDDLVTNGVGRLYARLAKVSGAPLLCLEVPAPKADAAHILRGAEAAFVAQGIGEIGVTPARTRLKLWSLQQEATRRFCAGAGIRYVESPPGTRDRDGYLERAYYAKDATHANTAFGGLVLRQLEEAVAPVPPG